MSMTYFIVDIPYDQCFSAFFNNDLEFPNFYRLSELLPDDSWCHHLTLLVPLTPQALLPRFQAQMISLGLRSSAVQTNDVIPFAFNPQGQVPLPQAFRDALVSAASECVDAPAFYPKRKRL